MHVQVLIIEDDPWLGELQADVLMDEGHDVVIARNALEAIDAVDQTPPDVIIADVLLTGSTVFTLLNELQSYDDTRRIPVILCTGLAEQFSVAHLAAYNVKRVIDKATMEADALQVAVKAVCQ